MDTTLMISIRLNTYFALRLRAPSAFRSVNPLCSIGSTILYRHAWLVNNEHPYWMLDCGSRALVDHYWPLTSVWTQFIMNDCRNNGWY